MFNPENDLEKSILQSYDDASYTPVFFKKLLASEIYFVISNIPPNNQNSILNKGEKVNIQSIEDEGIYWLPVFSSAKQLVEWTKSTHTFGHLNAKDFFEMCRGAHVILDPNHDKAWRFTPQIVDDLLNGSFFKPQSTIAIKKPTTILVRDPGNKYKTLTDTLSRLFKRNHKIKAAYLVECYNPEINEPEHPLIGIQTSGNYQQTVGEAGIVATRICENKYFVDFLNFNQNSNLFSNISPFFQKHKFIGLFG